MDKQGINSDPTMNPHAWDAKAWEALIALCSGGGSYASCEDIHSNAKELTRLHCGERPGDTE